jgi:hypothetical protein
MGLDMYAFSRANPEEDKHELFYWRKFNALHGWMERLYREKGGTEESFNCVDVELTVEDLLRLQMDTINNKLTPTPGFFFGEQTIFPEDKESVYEFVSKGLTTINLGEKVYYTSWW